MFLCQAVMALSFNTAGIVAPVATRELGLRPEALGPYVTLSALFGGVGGVFLAGWVRRYGGVRSLQFGLAFTLAGILLAATGNVWLIALSTVPLGMGGSMLPIATIHLIARMAPPGRAGLVFAINQCGAPTGIGAGGILIPLLLRQMGWQAVLMLLGLVVAVMAAAIQSVRAVADADRSAGAVAHRPNLLEPLRLVWRHAALRSLLPMSVIYMMTMSAGMGYLVSYANLELGKTLLVAGTSLAVAHVASITARLAMGWLLDRVGRPFQALGGFGIGTGVTGLLLGALGLLAADPSDGVLLVVTALFGAFGFGWTAVWFASIARLAPEGQRAAAASGMNLFQMLGALAGPLVFSVLARATGQMAAGFFALSLLSLASGVWLLAGRRR
jgi:MFS family permease